LRFVLETLEAWQSAVPQRFPICRGAYRALISALARFFMVARVISRETIQTLMRSHEKWWGIYFDGSRGTLMKEWVTLEGDYSSWIKLAKEARRFVGGGN
jgi:hypothetical protein